MARKKKETQIEIILGIILIIVMMLLGINIEEIEEIFKFSDTYMVNKITAEESKNVELVGEDILKIHFFDQTTPNMIQGLKGIFARKPLISIGI